MPSTGVANRQPPWVQPARSWAWLANTPDGWLPTIHNAPTSGSAGASFAVPETTPEQALAATVAVNPFLGQTGEDLATTSARLTRTAGIRLTRDRRDYAPRKGMATLNALNAYIGQQVTTWNKTSSK